MKLSCMDQSHRRSFRIYTGNDLAINMIEYGSDYVLGLATFDPVSFARRDRLWAAGDPAYYGLSDALQHLGNIAFRAPVPAYKHSAAIYLHLSRKISSPDTHAMSPRRPAWEADLMRECLLRPGKLQRLEDFVTFPFLDCLQVRRPAFDLPLPQKLETFWVVSHMQYEV